MISQLRLVLQSGIGRRVVASIYLKMGMDLSKSLVSNMEVELLIEQYLSKLLRTFLNFQKRRLIDIIQRILRHLFISDMIQLIIKISINLRGFIMV